MAEAGATLETTPTWAVATVCFCLILVSIFIEHMIHLLDKFLTKRRRKALNQALEKVKSELILLGFMSLLLTVSEKPIADICISRSVAESFLPCEELTSDEDEQDTKCAKQGKVSLVSRNGVQQLQYLIFVLAVFHVFSSIFTFALGMAKMWRWESWEAETRTMEYQFSKDPRRFQLAHQTSFGKRHLKCWSDNRFLRLPVSFTRQFYNSVSKADYLTLRHGFVTAHFAEGSNFDFRKYIRRALEKDFGVVVGIRWWIWICTVFFLFFNAHAFYNYLWLPFIPLVMLLVVGTKLQGIITKMCLDSHDKSHVVRGTLLVRPSDHFFWFNSPKLLLHLMNYILFQNSFQMAFFTWTWYKFGFRSCFHRKTEDIVIRIAMGVIVQILCGYVTLPLYALVTQMGTSMRKSVFTEGVEEGLKRWKAKARKNVATRSPSNYPARLSLDDSLDTSLDTSPSFNTLGTSFAAECYAAIEVRDDEIVADEEEQESRTIVEHQKVGSFHGFDMTDKQA